MKSRVRNIFCILFFMVLASSAYAQETTDNSPAVVSYNGRLYYLKGSSVIDWKRYHGGEQRYAIGFHPFNLINSGVKFDFEYEFRTRQWLQFQAAYHGFGWSHSLYGRSNFESGFTRFYKLGGFGVGASYKYMLSNHGWYCSGGLTFNYYDVHYPGLCYSSFVEDGNILYEPSVGALRNRYFKPGCNINIGLQLALSKNVFFDGFTGIGYSQSIMLGSGDKRVFNSGSPWEWGYSGITWSLGFRIGVLWEGRRSN